jgi:hypothetical protein
VAGSFGATNSTADWLASLENNATNSATNKKISGVWVELVKVKKWYSMRLMRWDATNKRKEYVKYIGTLEKCKRSTVYSAEALRLEKRRFTVSGGAIVIDPRAYKPNASGLVH